MQRIILNIIFSLLSVSNLIAQSNALIIKHVGLSDKDLIPIVITTEDTINKQFSSKYLRRSQTSMVPLFTKHVTVNDNELSILNDILMMESFKVKDSLPIKQKRFGSFSFMLIRNDSLIEENIITNKDKTFKLLNQLLVNIPRKNMSKYDLIIDQLLYLIKQFESNNSFVISEDIIIIGVKGTYEKKQELQVKIINNDDDEYFSLSLQKFNYAKKEWGDLINELQMCKNNKIVLKISEKEIKEVDLNFSYYNFDYSIKDKFRFCLKHGSSINTLTNKKYSSEFLLK